MSYLIFHSPLHATESLNSQEFIKSVDELLTVRESTTQVQERLLILNDSVQKSGQLLVQKARGLTAKRLVRQHIQKAIEACTNCLRALNMMARANEFIDQKEYYLAIKVWPSLAVLCFLLDIVFRWALFVCV